MAHYKARLALNDFAVPSVADVWQDRMVHFLQGYQMREYATGQPVPGTPQPGQAPIHLVRRPDAWRRTPGVTQEEIQNIYPDVSTTWKGWTNSKERRVMTLMAPHVGQSWVTLVRAGFGGLAGGAMWKDGMPDLSWFTDQSKTGPGLQSLLDAWSGNGGGGDSLETTSGPRGLQIGSSAQPGNTRPTIAQQEEPLPQDGSNA